MVGYWTWSWGRWPWWPHKSPHPPPQQQRLRPCGENSLWFPLHSQSGASASSAGSCSCTPSSSCRPASCSSSKCEPRAPEEMQPHMRLPVLLGEARPPRPLGGGGQSQGRAWAAGHRADCAPPFNRCLWRAHPARLRLADLTVGHLPYQIRQPPQTPSIPNPSPLPRRHPASSDPTAQKTSCRVAQLPLSSAARLHCGGPQAGTVTSGDMCASGAEHRGLGNTDSSCKCTPQ